MEVPFVDLKSQYAGIKSEIDNAIASVFEEGNFIGGVHVKKFESEFSKVHKISHCIGVGNGTDALYAALKMMGVGPGDEVLTPALSWISSAEFITLTGATPVFVDVDAVFYTIDPVLLEQKISSKTKAVVVVHLYGQMADMRTIQDITVRHNIKLIEDCAHAHFAEADGKKAGTFGDAGCFSFYPTKNLGAYGDGGCVITQDAMLAERVRRYTNHGGLVKDEHLTEGINSRLDTLQAAILNVKLNALSHWTEKRIHHAKRYRELLEDTHEVTLPDVRTGTLHVFHLFVIRTKQRDELKKYLADHGIETMVHYPQAIPLEPAYGYLNHTVADFPVASMLTREILSLPIYPDLTDEHIQYVCEKIRRFFLGTAV